MNVNIEESWNRILSSEFNSTYFKDLVSFVKKEYNEYICYPSEADIFSAFEYCTFDDLKVVIIGQDPYHNENQANGLCFSVSENMAIPPSLQNIFKEIETDLNKPIPENGNLERWAKQGVLLLNATLTVRAHMAGSHQKKGWEIFTNHIISQISKHKNDIVFLLWGGFAKKKSKLIDHNKHTILTSGHPSPLSANRGYWFGNRHFSKTNSILTGKNISPIDW
ncbi:UNVERIFIED_CONTAM: hypothetical protein GTU68_045727 [Idotea baltica]|nr:hypothetical protein [Idotea baltica]